MRAAAYARYSTDHQTDNSIAYQMIAIEKYCLINNLTVTVKYTDEAQSGTNMDREAFKSLVAAAKRKEFDVVVIYDISRGSRDVGDWFNFRKAMQMLSIQVISVEDKLGDLLNPNDFLVELINVGLGQHQVLTSRQKSIDGVAVKATQGAFLGGFAPLGYDIVNGEYIINETEAEAVRTIFNLYSKGESYNYILNLISDIRGKRGRPLGKNSLHSILTNERYIGVYTWNKRKMKLMRKWAGGEANPNCVRIEDFIPPIINKEVWERVQIRMKDNKRNGSNNSKRREYLLSGMIECTECGATYVGHVARNPKGIENLYYVCGNKYRTHTCKAKNINADELETFVVQQLKAYLLKTDFEEMAEIIANKVNSASLDLTAEKKEIATISAQISNGTKAILNGVDYPELQDELIKLRLRKSELEDIVVRNTSNTKKVDKNKIVELFQSALENWNTQLKQIIKLHITRIYANIDGSCTVNVGVNVAHKDGCGDRI